MAFLGSFFEPSKNENGEPTPAFGLSAVVAYKEKADRALAQQAEQSAALEEKITALEEELRELRYAHHSLSHTEPDDPDSRAYARWQERQTLLERHIEDAESELAAVRANGI